MGGTLKNRKLGTTVCSAEETSGAFMIFSDRPPEEDDVSSVQREVPEESAEQVDEHKEEENKEDKKDSSPSQSSARRLIKWPSGRVRLVVRKSSYDNTSYKKDI